MAAQQNRKLMETIFAGLEKGDGRAFIDALADDITWRMIGTTKWSGTYTGKDVVRQKLLRPLFAQFADTYTNTAKRIVADGDIVVVECQGSVMAKSGLRYDNAYCWVCRIADGKLHDLTEYMDTALVEAALGDPGTPDRAVGYLKLSA